MNGQQSEIELIPPGTKVVVVEPHDAAALQRMYAHRAQVLPRIQAQAASWIPGLTAISGVLSASTIVGIANDADAMTDMLYLAGALGVAGAVLTALGIYYIYSAAHGDPMTEVVDEFLDSKQVNGAATRWDSAVKEAASAAKTKLAMAVLCTALGIAAAGIGLFIAWMPQPAAASEDVCVRVGTAVVQLGEVLPVTAEADLTLTPCPN